MSGARKLSDQQLDVLGEMRERGKSLPHLARQAKRLWGVEISPNALSWQMLRIGADLPPDKRQAPRIGPEIVKRGNHLVRRFKPEEDRRLLELEAQGLGHSAIGKLLDRKQNSVRGRLMTLARHAERELER